MKHVLHDGATDDYLESIAVDPLLREAVYSKIGEYCHECRNRLNSLKLGLYLARQQASPEVIERWAEVDRRYGDLEARLELLHQLCRPMVLSKVQIDLDLLISDRRLAWTQFCEARHVGLRFEPPSHPVVASLDVERLGRALDGLVAWRSSEADAASLVAEVRWWLESDVVHLVWAEAPSTQPSRPVETNRWALAWLIRVVAEHGGQTRISGEPGWKLEIRWPSPGSANLATAALAGATP